MKIAALLVLLLPTVAGVEPRAEQAPSPQSPAPGAAAAMASRQVFRSLSQLVPLTVTVTDRNKHFVKGLTAGDFTVLEDGIEQELQFFDAAEVPLDLIILLDTSSSMSDKMDIVHEAAVGFLRTLRPGDRGAVVGFADGVDVLQQLTAERAVLERAVRQTVARGATSLHNALYIALKQFGRGAQAAGDVRRQAIAVLSDGDDTSSLVSFEDVLAVARSSGVGIYPIALQSKHAAALQVATGARRAFSEAEYSLRRLAQETGAQAFFPTQVAELKAVYATIAEELSNQYSLAYVPTDRQADGRYRRILVRIDGRPELRLRTRTGYTAEYRRNSVQLGLQER